MKLVDLNPGWLSAGGEGVTRNGQPVPERHGVGVYFDCPCGCDERCYVMFRNPTDGGPARLDGDTSSWERTGDTFEALTLAPSIYRRLGCGWHGWIRNGEIVNA